MSKRANFYALLGLLRSATQEEIRRAYHKAAKRLHPDTNQAPGETELFLDIQTAYQVLSDPARRASYDATLDPEETPPEVVEKRILLSRKEIARLGETQLIYALIELIPGEEQKKAAAGVPLNLCLVLDCSTSMKGERLDTVKSTAVQIIRKLKPQDIFSVIAFNDRAEVIIPATRHQGNTHKLETKIQLLQTGGGTEIFKGLEAGFDEIRRYVNPTVVSHIILLTDGQRTTGIDSMEAAKMAADRGVRVYTVGVGTVDGEVIGFEGWSMRVRLDEDTLKAVARDTKGEYFYAGTAEILKQVYESLSTRLTVEKKETEVSGLLALAAAALVLMSAGLSLLWFNRVL